MLQEMRKYAKSWAANILLGVLSLAFVSWGVGDIFRGGGSTAVATVGGTQIDQNVFRRDYTNVVRNVSSRREKPLSTEEARKMNLGGQVLEQAIDDMALQNAANALGLTASDAMISSEIQRAPAFAGLTGKFEKQQFLTIINRAGYTEQGFIERVRIDTERAQLLSAAQGGFMLPPGYARALFAIATEMRAAEYIVVDAKAIGTIETPSDAVLQAYVKAHPNRYSTPEYRDVTYAWISPEDVASGLSVTDDQVKQAYEAHLDQFVLPEKRDLQQIEYKSQGEAAAARARIASGTSFDQVAPIGQKPVALGELVAADLDPAQAKAVFALRQGEVSPPLQSASGRTYVLIKVVGIKPGSSKTFDQAKDELRKAMLGELAQAKLVDVANAYTDASSSGLSLQEAAKKVGMHVARVSAMDPRGLGPDGSKSTAPDDPDFRKLVLAAEPGEDGDPQPLKTGTYVISVNGSIPPKIKPLDQVRVQALTDWTNEQRSVLIKKKAQELAAAANADHQIDAVAKTIGATVQQSPALRHTFSDDVFSASLVREIFQAAPGQAVSGPKGKGGDWVVARVTGIVHPALPEQSDMYRAAVAQISQEAASAISDSYTAALRADQGVSYNNKLMQQIVGSESGEGS